MSNIILIKLHVVSIRLVYNILQRTAFNLPIFVLARQEVRLLSFSIVKEI